MTDERTILFELRESARTNRNEKYRELAREAADQFSEAANAFCHSPTDSNLQAVVGLRALIHRLMKNKPTDDAPGGGMVRVESTEKIRVAA